MSAWPTCRQCGDYLERDHWDRWRCVMHGIQKQPSRLANFAAGVVLVILALAVAAALAITIIFAVAWFLSEGTNP